MPSPPSKAQSDDEDEAVHRGGGAMTETQATVSLFKTIVGGIPAAAGMAAGRGRRAAGLIDSRAARRRVGLHVPLSGGAR